MNNKNGVTDKDRCRVFNSFEELSSIKEVRHKMFKLSDMNIQILLSDKEKFDDILQFIEQSKDPITGRFVVKAYGLNMLKKYAGINSTYPIPLNLAGKKLFSFASTHDVIQWLTASFSAVVKKDSKSFFDLDVNFKVEQSTAGKYITFGFDTDFTLHMVLGRKLRHKSAAYDKVWVRQFVESPLGSNTFHPKSNAANDRNSSLLDRSAIPRIQFNLNDGIIASMKSLTFSDSVKKDLELLLDVIPFGDMFGQLAHASRLKEGGNGKLERTGMTNHFRVARNMPTHDSLGVIVQPLFEATDLGGHVISISAFFSDRLGKFRDINSKEQRTAPLQNDGILKIDYGFIVMNRTPRMESSYVFSTNALADHASKFGTDDRLEKDNLNLSCSPFPSVIKNDVTSAVYELAEMEAAERFLSNILKDFGINLGSELLVLAANADALNDMYNENALLQIAHSERYYKKEIPVVSKVDTIEVIVAGKVPYPKSEQGYNNKGLYIDFRKVSFKRFDSDNLREFFPSWTIAIQ